MIDWLRRGNGAPAVTVGGRELPLAIRRHPRAMRLTMRLAPDGSEVRITLPRWGRTSDAVVFAHKRIDWLETQLAAIPVAAPPVAGGTLLYRGEELAIAWEPLFRHLERVMKPEGERAHGVVLMRLKQWIKLAHAQGTFPYFDELKTSTRLEEFFERLADCERHEPALTR